MIDTKIFTSGTITIANSGGDKTTDMKDVTGLLGTTAGIALVAPILVAMLFGQIGLFMGLFMLAVSGGSVYGYVQLKKDAFSGLIPELDESAEVAEQEAEAQKEEAPAAEAPEETKA